jgi:ferritin
MISQKMQDAIGAQVHAELESAYLYLAMSIHCEESSFKGFGRWLRVQHAEETAHATKLIDYLLERGGRLGLKAIAAAAPDFGSPLQVFEKVLEHERKVTALIHELYSLAVEEKDIATQVFLQWFVSEQVEEEANASEIVEKLRMVGDKGGSLLYLDKELGKRSADD